MDQTELKNRTKRFALTILDLSDNLPNNSKGWTISKQIVRSATSVAANYRAVCRARSDKDFIAKMGIVIEEADETLFWLEIIDEAKLLANKNIDMNPYLKEANELVAIFVASNRTIKKRLNNNQDT